MKLAFVLVMAAIIAALILWGMSLAGQIDKHLNDPDDEEE